MKNNKIYFSVNNISKKYILLCLMLLLCICCFGCGKKDKDNKEAVVEDGTVVFTFGDEPITKGEVYIYINTVKEKYEAQYGEDIWEITLPKSEDGETTVTMEEFTREEVINEIIKVKTLCAQAESYGITLTTEQETNIQTAASEFYDGLTDVDIETLEMTLDIVIKVMTENTIATMVENKLLEENPIEISDEEARMTTFYDMYFNCYSYDENGVMVPYTEEQKTIQYENALTACSTLATAIIDENSEAENIENLAEYYKLDYADEYTITPEEIMNTYGEEVYNLLYSMENGDYSTVVETEYGYHVFQMIALTDKKATQARKDSMTAEAVELYLQENLMEWQKEIDSEFTYPESINMEVYNTIMIN